MFESISQNSILSNLSRETTDYLYRVGKTYTIEKNEVIFLESEPAEHFYFILEGKVRISRLNREGKEVVIAILGAGNFFGEMSLLDGFGMSTDASADEKSTILSVRKDNFYQLLERYPEVAREVLREFACRIRNSDSQIKGLSLLNARGKVASAILRWAKDQGEEIGESVIIEKVPTQKELASYVGLTRETFNRILMDMQREGFIEIRSGSTIVIRNFTEFRNIFGPLF